MSALQQAARKPSAEQTSQPCCRIRNPGIISHLLGIKTTRIVEILRHPEKVKVPGGVAQKLPQDQPPELWKGEKAEPRDIGFLLGRCEKDLSDFDTFLSRKPRMVGGQVIVAQPPKRPHQPRSAA